MLGKRVSLDKLKPSLAKAITYSTSGLAHDYSTFISFETWPFAQIRSTFSPEQNNRKWPLFDRVWSPLKWLALPSLVKKNRLSPNLPTLSSNSEVTVLLSLAFLSLFSAFPILFFPLPTEKKEQIQIIGEDDRPLPELLKEAEKKVENARRCPIQLRHMVWPVLTNLFFHQRCTHDPVGGIDIPKLYRISEGESRMSALWPRHSWGCTKKDGRPGILPSPFLLIV